MALASWSGGAGAVTGAGVGISHSEIPIPGDIGNERLPERVN